MQKLGLWKELLIVADKIYKYDAYNVKAIYRKCLALKNLQEFEDATLTIENLFKKAEADSSVKIDETNRTEFEALLKSIKIANTEYLKKQKSMYKSMFSQ